MQLIKMGNKKNIRHYLEDDISPVERCEKCHQPFSFGKCSCKQNKLKKIMKTKAPKKAENKNPVKDAKEVNKKNLVGVRPSPKMRKQLKYDFKKLDSKKSTMSKKLNKTIKEHGAVTFDEYMEKDYGKLGTKKRANAELKIKKIREKMEEKLYTNQDMIGMYNEAQELALEKGKYTPISGFKKIIQKLTKKNTK